VEEAMQAYERWADVREDQRVSDFKAYAYNIAEARFVMRRVSRIVNEEAKQHGLDPLLHQALLQIFGTAEGDELAVNKLAGRLDVPPAFASRLVSQLEEQGLAERRQSTRDRRVTLLSLTEAGIQRLREIDDAVHYQIAYFQRQLDPHQQIAALSIFAFYVGIESSSPIAAALRANMIDPPAKP
jgi:DNA-binding MarR family transcriptional regulator